MSGRVVVRPSAKINLSLRVGAAGKDGFHDVRTVLQSISITDTLTVTAREGRFVLSVQGPGVPADRDNLVWRAAEELWRAAGRSGEPRGVHVRLEKGIPVEAGLGGGSADAAGALVALNAVWELRRSRRDLRRLAAMLGSDVPFFLQGGTAVGVGRGDEIYPVDDVARLGIVVIKPSFGVATGDAYAWFDEDRAAGLHQESNAGVELDLGWSSGSVIVGNDLEPPVGRRHAVLAEMVEACRSEGALASAMTGSGSAVFGVFSEASASSAAPRLRRPDWLVLLSRTVSRREAARKIGL
jgi:4-diphosphocytidyl-2-C-methyl-D-erythritol kinase